jgi:hypothetical protein
MFIFLDSPESEIPRQAERGRIIAHHYILVNFRNAGQDLERVDE